MLNQVVALKLKAVSGVATVVFAGGTLCHVLVAREPGDAASHVFETWPAERASEELHAAAVLEADMLWTLHTMPKRGVAL
jgi:hypothetical protein